MITEKDLQEAIAECQGQRNPNANTCIKLAAYLTIQKELFGDKPTDDIGFIDPSYSYARSPITYQGDSTFSELINGREIEDVLPVFDELIDTIKVINPRLYEGFLRKLREV